MIEAERGIQERLSPKSGEMSVERRDEKLRKRRIEGSGKKRERPCV
jgi:hypothetical protein